jgi:hypothetical protein
VVTFRIVAVELLRHLHMAHCTICLGDLSLHEIDLTALLCFTKTYAPLIYSAQAKVLVWHVRMDKKTSLFSVRGFLLIQA